jgi:hypothetical protein
MNDLFFPLGIIISSFILILIRTVVVQYSKHKKISLLNINQQAPLLTDVLIIILIISLAALFEYLMHRVPICTCGTIKLWVGNIWSSENSQQISDPYTFTHITHGFLFYALLRWLAPKLPVQLRLVLAVTIEATWEVFENTNFIINRYRTATFSLNYYGDSILNSSFDSVACLTGFLLAYKLPTKVSICGIILLELLLTVSIRDSLLLSTLTLIYPIEFIKNWQLGK